MMRSERKTHVTHDLKMLLFHKDPGGICQYVPPLRQAAGSPYTKVCIFYPNFHALVLRKVPQEQFSPKGQQAFCCPCKLLTGRPQDTSRKYLKQTKAALCS